MTKPATIRTVWIKVGDGASPETFSQPCMINTERGIQFQSQGQDVYVPNCDTPESPVWRSHNKTGLSATISGSGKLDTGTITLMDAWFAGDIAKNVKVFCDVHGNWLGGFKLTAWDVKSNPSDGSKAEATMTMESDGDLQPYAVA